MTDPKCTCELIDVSTHAGPQFVRGRSRGCQIHPPSARELQQQKREAADQERIAAAEKAAREAP